MFPFKKETFCFLSYKPDVRFNLTISSNQDIALLKIRLAEELNVPCTVGQWKNPKALKKGSLEDAARQRRFQFLSHLAKKIRACAVVLAHNEDDLAETVLMRILRGTGLQGLRGILPQRKIDGTCYVRPLLSISKDDTRSAQNQRFIADRA